MCDLHSSLQYPSNLRQDEHYQIPDKPHSPTKGFSHSLSTEVATPPSPGWTPNELLHLLEADLGAKEGRLCWYSSKSFCPLA